MRISDWSSDVCSPDLSRSGGTRLGAERGQHACAIERGNRPGPSGGLPLALVPFGAASTHQRELEPLFVVAQGLYRNRLDGTVEKPKQLVRQPACFVPIADIVSYPALMHAPSTTHARSSRPLHSSSTLTAWNEDRKRKDA